MFEASAYFEFFAVSGDKSRIESEFRRKAFDCHLHPILSHAINRAGWPGSYYILLNQLRFQRFLSSKSKIIPKY